MKQLASVRELGSASFRSFMAWINGFASVHGLPARQDESKLWEYPWTWQYLRNLSFSGTSILNLGSEISLMPWFFASLGAHVRMVAAGESLSPKWFTWPVWDRETSFMYF